MRFTKFMAAAMAAMTICSCAQQTEEFDTPNDGKTRILFSTQLPGITSYAYNTDESVVESGKVYAFKGGICIGLNELTIVGGKVTASVELSGDIEANDVIQLRAIANDTVTGESPTLTEIENRMTVKTEGAIPMSATTAVTITAPGGANVATAVKLTRRVGRILVKAATGTTLPKGLEVSYTKNNSAAYFFKPIAAGTVQTGATKVEPDATTGLVDYLFPSGGVVFTITTTSGATVTTSAQQILANKSYTLVVTSSGDENVEVDFEVGNWDSETDINVDMGTYSGALELTTSTLWSTENGVMIVKSNLADDKTWSFSGGFSVSPNVMSVKGQTFASIDSVTVQKGKGSLKKRHLEIYKSGSAIRIQSLTNIFGVNDTIYAQIHGKSAKAGLLEAKVSFVHKSLVDADFQDAYKKLSVSTDGGEWLNMNSTSITIDALIAEIKAQSTAIETAGGHEAYIKATPEAFHKTITHNGSNYSAPCPAPFIVATRANFEAIGFTSTLALATENTSTADNKISRIDNATSDYSVFKIASVVDATKFLYFTGKGTAATATGAGVSARYLALVGSTGATVSMGLDGVMTSNASSAGAPRLYRCVYIP